MQQLQQGQNQNELARYTMAKAQQEDVTRNALNQAYQSNMNPTTGEINYAGVYKSLAGANAGASIPAIQKSQFEVEKEKSALAKTDQEVFALKNKALGSALITAMNDTSDAGLGRAFDMLDSQNIPTKDLRTQFAAIPDPAKRLEIIKSYVSQHPEGIAAMNFVAPKPKEITLSDGSKIFRDENPNSPTFNKEVMAPTTPGMTPFQTGTLGVGQERNRIAQGQLGVAQGKLNVSQAGLGLRAIAADPFNLNGALTKFPLGAGSGGNASGVAGARSAPTAVPATNTISGKQIPLGDAINQGLTGSELLSVMPKNIAGQVTAILEHRAAPPTGNTTRSSQLMQIVQAADPTYDAQQYKTKQGIETAFTAGLPSRTLKSINVVADHLKVLDSTIDALNNGDVKAFNQIGNAISTQMSVPAPTDFNAVKRIVADELAKAVIGGVGALGDRKSIDETINAASGPVALRSVINRYQQLMDGQRNGLSDQYKSGGGNNAEVLKLLSKTKLASAPAGSIHDQADAILRGGK
jgi:hypothetical protein